MASSREGRELSWTVTVVIGLVTAILVGSVIALIVNLGSVSWLELYRLQHDGIRDGATVTAYDAANHNSCSYRYAVAGVTYTNTDSCGDYYGGGTVMIVYDEHHPSISITDNPTSDLTSDLITWCAAMAGFGIGVPVGFRSLYRFFFSGEIRRPRF